MFCKYCGNPLPDNAKFCAKCGAVQPEEPAPAPSQTEQPPAPAKKAKEKKNSPVVTIILAVLLVAALAAVAFLVYDNYIKRGPDESEAEKTTAAEEADTEALKENDPAPSAQPAAETQPAETEPPAQPQPASPDPAPGSPLTLKDVCFTVNGVTYSYPFSPDQFTEERGWTMIGGDPDKTIPAGYKTMLRFTNDGVEVDFQFRNDTEQPLSTTDCFLQGIYLVLLEEDSDRQTGTVRLPRGITPESSADELQRAFGPAAIAKENGGILYAFCVDAPHTQLADYSSQLESLPRGPVNGVPILLLYYEQPYKMLGAIFGFIDFVLNDFI